MTAVIQNGGLQRTCTSFVRGLKLKLALEKTFIGRIQQGFDFLGYRFNASGFYGLARKTIDNQLNQRLRPDEPNAPDQRVQATMQCWVRARISPLVVGATSHLA